MIIDFHPDRGAVIYDRLRHLLHLVRRADELDSLEAQEANQAVADVLVALQAAAFSDGSDPIQGRSRAEHLGLVQQHNSLIFRLVTCRGPVALRLVENVVLPFGSVLGCTTVYPLTAVGYATLRVSPAGVGALFPRHVVPKSECGQAQPSLYIAGVIDLRRLNHPDWVKGTPMRVLSCLVEHVAALCPRVRWDGDEFTLTTTDGTRLPRILAAADDGSESARLLFRAGFREIGRKTDGSVKFELDLEGWNEGFDPGRSGQVLRVIRSLQWAQSQRRRARTPRE